MLGKYVDQRRDHLAYVPHFIDTDLVERVCGCVMEIEVMTCIL
jgi:hypothetical protein